MDAATTRIITAREFPRVIILQYSPNKRRLLTSFSTHLQMVLIVPRIETDESSPFGGILRVTFPEDSGCEEFSTPLIPNDECFANWTMYASGKGLIITSTSNPISQLA